MDIKSLNKEDLVELLDNYSKKDIAFMFSISVSTLNRVLKKNNLTKNNYGPNKLNEESVKQIRNMYFNQNYTQQELAKKYKVTQATVGRVVNNVYYKQREFPEISGKADVKLGFKFDGNKR